MPYINRNWYPWLFFFLLVINRDHKYKMLQVNLKVFNKQNFLLISRNQHPSMSLTFLEECARSRRHVILWQSQTDDGDGGTVPVQLLPIANCHCHCHCHCHGRHWWNKCGPKAAAILYIPLGHSYYRPVHTYRHTYKDQGTSSLTMCLESSPCKYMSVCDVRHDHDYTLIHTYMQTCIE